ncbi:MAG: HEAT repeat domain-containing protein [Candidatus Ozemobacter sibiricus]|uniref:HEAT repeat domain-containing protein n=1 Tax=Candidatus Ozemobacter sibiricus TaxID=2268124 RepID=A0A367ZKS2_9BACT|nr:MAG: HEAT repeat domain-containing protein [Candidatus Ozemobacter sibiricus]
MPDKMTMKGECAVQRELEDLVTDLKSTLITKRLKAVKALGKLKTPLAIEPLRDVLNDRSKEVRCATVEAIAQIGPSNLAEILVPLARDRSADVRLRVAYALAGTSHDDAVRCLFELIRDPKDPVAVMAAKSLARSPKASLAQLIRLFGDKSWKVRSRAAMAITRMGRAAETALQSAMEDPDPNIRFWACLCLGHLRDRTHTKALLDKLSDRDLGVRLAALRSLREIGDPHIVSRLFEALSQPSEQVRDLIYDILKDFGTYSIPYLMESLSSEYWMGRSLAARALAEMGTEAILPLTEALEGQNKERKFWAIKILGQMKEESAFPEIRTFLSDPDSEIRMAAVQAMGSFQNPDAIPLLIERFIDPSWVVRREACKAIVRFGPAAYSALLSALGSMEEDVRYWALRAIGELKPPGAFHELIKLLRDRSWNIRKTTAEILATFGEDALLELTSLATESDAEVRFWVLQSLGRIGSKISLPLLFKALEDPSEAIRTAAQKALAHYGPTIVDDLFTLFKSENRRLLESVVATFRNMGQDAVLGRLCHNLGKYDDHVNYWIRRAIESFGPAARPAVLALLESKNHEVRRQALLALGQIGQPGDAETVIPHLKDEHWPARIAAAETLGVLGDASAVEPLMDALEDDDEDLALAAARALGRIGDHRAVPALLSALTREYWTLKLTVIGILGQMRVQRAVPDLLRLLDEDLIDLKIPVVKALGEIGHPDSYRPLRERFERETDPEARSVYLRAFAALGNPAIIPTLIELTKPDHPWEERRAAIKALGLLHAEEAKAPLLTALRDADLLISREALAALKAILPPADFRKLEEAHATARKREEAFQKSFQEGMRLMKLGQLADAEKALKAAARINPKAAYVYSALGNIYYKSGKLIDATKAYVMATTVEPRDITLKINLGMVYYRRRAYREATEVFTTIAKLVDPRSQQGQYAAKMLEKIKAEVAQALKP